MTNCTKSDRPVYNMIIKAGVQRTTLVKQFPMMSGCWSGEDV